MQTLHATQQNLVEIEDAGIHATYFFSPENIRVKLQSFSHTEFDRYVYSCLFFSR